MKEGDVCIFQFSKVLERDHFVVCIDWNQDYCSLNFLDPIKKWSLDNYFLRYFWGSEGMGFCSYFYTLLPFVSTQFVKLLLFMFLHHSALQNMSRGMLQSLH